METSLMVNDYSEANEPKERTVKVICSFTTYVTVYGEDEDSWKEQVREMSSKELLEETDIIEIEEIEKID